MENSIYLTQCFILEVPESGLDCYTSPQDNHTTQCIECGSIAKFLVGGSITDYYSPGHLTYLVLAVLTILIGLAGSVMSYFIITVLKRQSQGVTSFEIMLMVLAYVDLFCGLAQAICALCTIIYFRNWSRNLGATLAYVFSLMFAIFAKSASSFITVVIALERYLKIAFPIKTRNWFTPFSARILALFALLLSSALTFFPIIFCQYVGVNTFKNVKSVSELDYLIYHTSFARIWYQDLKGSSSFDFWIPFALLLLFNGLIFYHIRKFSLRRKELMNSSLKKDLSAGKMFLPIVTVLIICNIPPIIFAYFQANWQTLYLELVIGIFLCAALNSAANLPIYYLKSPGFKEEAQKVLRHWFRCCCRWRGRKPTSVKVQSVWFDVSSSTTNIGMMPIGSSGGTQSDSTNTSDV